MQSSESCDTLKVPQRDTETPRGPLFHSKATYSAIPLQLPLSPVRLFPIGLEFADIVPVKRPHHADPGEHRRHATRDEHQGLHRVLPFRRGMLGLRKLGDVVAGVLEVTSWRPPGRSIGSSKGRFQPVGGLRKEVSPDSHFAHLVCRASISTWSKSSASPLLQSRSPDMRDHSLSLRPQTSDRL
jgi:hypothetical protein